MGVHEPITTVVSTKGRVILPKAIRDLRHWPAGTRLTVEDTPEGVLLKAVPIFPETELDSVFASMRYDKPALSVADMNEVIDKEANRRAYAYAT